MKAIYILAAATLMAGAVSAQTLTGVKLSAAQVKVGETVTATGELKVEGATNCGMRMNWGDGAISENKINQAQDVPFIATHAYAKPGTYTVMAEPHRVGSSLKCNGKNQSINVTVAAPVVAAAPVASAPVAVAPVAKPAAAAVAAAPMAKAGTCPAGWKLAAPVNKKTKAFTCTAKANTKLPDVQVECPGDLTYFENGKKGQLGCRP